MPLIVQMNADGPEAAVIRQAAQMIRDGLVVAYPTDTLYALAVDPRNVEAVKRLYELKGRPETSPLTLIAADMAQVRVAAELSAMAERLTQRWWPGPLTILMRAREVIVREALAGGASVGIRIPDHPVAVALAREAGFCITATSANRSGAAAAATPRAVVEALPDVDGLLDAGPARGGAPSTIVNAAGTELTLVRDGAVAWSKVLESLQ